MDTWISINDSLPKIDIPVQLGHILDEYNEKDSRLWGKFIVDCEFLQSKEVIVAEQKGDGYEEDVGVLSDTGWMSNCDNVTHWKE